jgi:hypothetical protein
MTIHAVDWAQTRQIAQHPEQFKEMNPILGSHPSVQSVDIYMGSALIIHPVISSVLPSHYREAWQYISIGVSGGAVINNVNIGVRF